jgi:hypothetical protein
MGVSIRPRMTEAAKVPIYSVTVKADPPFVLHLRIVYPKTLVKDELI